MPGKTPASILLHHLHFGRVYRPDGTAYDVLEADLEEKYGIKPTVTAKTLAWCRVRELVYIERGPNGATIIEVTSKYRPPR